MFLHSDIGISTGAYRGLPLAAGLLRIRELAPAAEITSDGAHSLLDLDVGHAAVSDTLSSWLDDPRATLRHVHLHDNLGPKTGDVHNPLGTGVVDARAVIAKARGVGASMVIEHKNEDDVLTSLYYLCTLGLIEKGRTPHNVIDTEKLRPLTRVGLQEALRVVSAAQKLLP